MTQASTATLSLNKALNARNTKESPPAKEPQGKVAEKSDPEAQYPTSNKSPATTPLEKIVATVGQILTNDSLDSSTKKALRDIIVFTLIEKAKEDQVIAKSEASAEESFIRKSIRKDLTEMHNEINICLNGIQDTVNETLTSSSKLLTDTENVAAATKALCYKVLD